MIGRARTALAPALIAAAWAVACNRPPERVKAPEAPGGPAAVATVHATNDEPIRLAVSEPGRVLAYEETPIYARVAGYVREWKADMGASVTEGQPLAVLAVPDLDADLARKDALVRQAEAELRLAQVTVTVAEKEEQRLRSQSERLAKVGNAVLTADSIEESKFGYEAAQAAVGRARADVDVKAANVTAAAKERDYAKTMRDFAVIAAPYAGVVTARNVNRGDFVQPSAQARGEPLFVVQQTDKVRVRVAVPEADADWVNDRCDAGFRVQALRGREYNGLKVARASWSLSARERTLTAEIDAANADGALRPGMYVNGTISSERRGAWTLPAPAVVTRADPTQGDKSFCFVVEDDKAVQTPIRVGARDELRVEVLGKHPAGGSWQPFTGAEEVAADGSKLTDGQAVETRPAAK